MATSCDWKAIGSPTDICQDLADNAEWAKLDAAMDKSLLLQREPILFFAEVPLYESELDDNGSSQLVAKVLAFDLTSLYLSATTRAWKCC